MNNASKSFLTKACTSPKIFFAIAALGLMTGCKSEFERFSCESTLPHGHFTDLSNIEITDVTERERALQYPSVDQTFKRYKEDIAEINATHGQRDTTWDSVVATFSPRAQSEWRASEEERRTEFVRDMMVQVLGFDGNAMDDQELLQLAQNEVDTLERQRSDYAQVFYVTYEKNRINQEDPRVSAAPSSIRDNYGTLTEISDYGYETATCIVSQATQRCECKNVDFLLLEKLLS